MRRLICWFMVLGLIVSGCGTPATPIAFTRLADQGDEQVSLDDDFYKNDRGDVAVIMAGNPAEQQTLLSNLPRKFKPSVTTIDVLSTVIIGVFLRSYPTSGYTIHLDDVQLRGNELLLVVQHTTPKPNQLLEQAGPCSSFSVVGIDRALLPAGQLLTIRVIDQHDNELTTMQYQMP